MTTKFLVFVSLLLTCGCKEKVAKFLIDNSSKNITVERFKYEYEGHKMVSEIEARCFYLAGMLGERTVHTKHYEYDIKGRLIRYTSKMSIDSIPGETGYISVDTFPPSIYYYRYNLNDSVIEILNLETNGDTGYWVLYDFFPDGKQAIKGLSLKLNENAKSPKEIMDSGQRYHFYSREYFYTNKLCQQIKEYDGNGKLIELTEKKYSAEPPYRPVKTISSYYEDSEHNPFSDTFAVRKKIRYDNYAKGVANQARQDFCLLNSTGDTLAVQVSDFDEKGKIFRTVFMDYITRSGNASIFENDILKKDILFDLEQKERWEKDFFYYPDGTVKETRLQKKKFIE